MHLDTGVDVHVRCCEIDERQEDEPITLVGLVRHVITTMLVDRAWAEEVFMQMINKFENVALHRAGNSNIVDETVDIFKRQTGLEVGIRTLDE